MTKPYLIRNRNLEIQRFESRRDFVPEAMAAADHQTDAGKTKDAQ
jgi:hypothetical protein